MDMMRDSVLLVPNLSKFEIMPQGTHATKKKTLKYAIFFLFTTCSFKEIDRFGVAVGIGFLLA